MKFSQLIWDVLVWAHLSGDGRAYQALQDYATEHDGRLFIVSAAGQTSYEFIPNPVGKY
jgi:hypothetical protein